MPKNNLSQEIQELSNKIDAYKSKRKVLIQSYELTLLHRVELEIIALLKASSFDIIEHQLTDWITAKRGSSCLRVWFPKHADSFLGHFNVNIVYNDKKYTVCLLINHQFANFEYNYLTFDYNKQREKKRDEMAQELTQLKQLNVTDIDGSYVVSCAELSDDDCYELEPLSVCLKQIISLDEDTNERL